MGYTRMGPTPWVKTSYPAGLAVSRRVGGL